ncbi:alpha-1-inhibitor 3-like [Psammomys obesus]|uniref:alpha-1-inhibitor 3-like n=1 Tax=Psammomys obesus TaxID=48139 RepID=UPI002453465D|nr:alpha-1-inhibitor 3-like [Psammomys obesus]
MEELYAEAQHVAYRVYTMSRSYVYLETEAGILPCSKIHTVQAHFILKGPILLLLRELNFYYLVMAQGKIIHTGSHTHHMEPSECKCFSSRTVSPSEFSNPHQWDLSTEYLRLPWGLYVSIILSTVGTQGSAV